MLLEYEKEILENINHEACLAVMSKGLRYTEIVLALLKMYSNEYCLSFVLNMNEYENEYFSKQDIPLFCNVGKLAASQRSEKYKSGGVFYGSPTVLASDFVNKSVQIEKISTLMILNAENIEPDSAISFICYLFKENNSLGLIKAFTSDAIKIYESGLEQIARSLCLNKILFYPRFHELVKSSLSEINVTQVHLRQNEFMGEATLLIEDVIKKVYSNAHGGVGEFEYMKVLIYNQQSHDIANFKKLISLLFNTDSLTTFLYYQAMIDQQKKNNSSSSWIFDGSSHALLDVLRKMLQNDVEKSNENTASFVFDIVSDTFRLDLNPEEPKRIKLDPELSHECLCNEVNTIKTAKNLGIDENINKSCIDEHKQQDVESNEKEDVLSEIFESKLLSGFYLANPKIKQIAEILNQDLKAKTAILVQNRTVRKAVKQVLVSIFMSDINVSIFTHVEFLHSDDCNYKRIILLNPDLLSIRNVEYTATKGGAPSVFILQYKNTVEEQRFLEEIREEKYAFEKIIEDRARLPLKVGLDRIDMDDGSPDCRYTVTVDSREMRSKLPFFLYRAGNEINIKVLEIGDYLLGTTKCIERKSIEDFLGSLNSGRLYQQAQRLTHAYTNPILLLEFNEGKPVLGDFDDVENFRNSYIARFCLFLYNFPSFQVIWSNSHTNTVRIIRDMQKRDEAEQKSADEYDPELIETLLCIPGINSFSLNRVCKEFRNLYDLSASKMERLEKVLDSISATKVYNFFRHKFYEDTK
ncbi:uncharacterized protein VICG_00160 [Vittaforma corneae ATCC 50505]|uniref:ERCC4 domain-containing protein n=1 Tax=Vittaforma corneae (strain ATCC 50505) TaxID=993615 RepID=L2GQQ1_VITCO|nr:uncharacterized protein VICG_00160 [Vittaforma corneae ATCC 50505]ELA42845.1 hypothetical protein VICG_00160 [Vittaforma corneae ATCC 50505]